MSRKPLVIAHPELRAIAMTRAGRASLREGGGRSSAISPPFTERRRIAGRAEKQSVMTSWDDHTICPSTRSA
jgi:hypothetical protein